MNKFEELKIIFKGILINLDLNDKQVESITSIVRTPAEMTKIVDAIEESPNMKYEELYQKVLDSIDFEIKIDN